MQPKQFSMTTYLENNTENIDTFLKRIESAIDKLTENKSTRFFMKVAVNELVVNAMEHGYNKQGGFVSVRLRANQNTIYLNVSDNGKGVDPERLALEKPIESLDDLTERGWGLSILKKISSHMQILPNVPTGTVISVTLPLA